MPFPRNKVFRGHTLPYGTLAGASKELLKAYYYLNKDSDLPSFPCQPFELEEVVCADDELHQRDIARVVRALLETLPPRQAKVLRLRCGIDCKDHTLVEVGAIFDLTPERIRQIEQNGLKLANRPGTHMLMLTWLHYN